MSDKSENILIDYTKWILKWFAIVCVVIVVVIGGWIGYGQYQGQIVPMIAIECEGEKGFNPIKGGIKTKRYFLVQNIRSGSVPYALYEPSYHEKTITHDTSPDDYHEAFYFKKISSWKDRSSYSFGPKSYNDLHGFIEFQVVRDNLQVILLFRKNKSDKWKSRKIGKCRQITFDEFYADSERGLNEVKSKLKF